MASIGELEADYNRAARQYHVAGANARGKPTKSREREIYKAAFREYQRAGEALKKAKA